MIEAFHWSDGRTLTIAATTASLDTPLPWGITGDYTIRVYNAGTVPVFIRKGTNGVAATATVADFPVAPGESRVLRVMNNPGAPVTSLAAITAATAATLYVTAGMGGV